MLPPPPPKAKQKSAFSLWLAKKLREWADKIVR